MTSIAGGRTSAAETALTEGAIGVAGSIKTGTDTEVRIYLAPREPGLSFKPFDVRLDGQAPFKISMSDGSLQSTVSVGQQISIIHWTELDVIFKTPEALTESNLTIAGLSMNDRPVSVCRRSRFITSGRMTSIRFPCLLSSAFHTKPLSPGGGLNSVRWHPGVSLTTVR